MADLRVSGQYTRILKELRAMRMLPGGQEVVEMEDWGVCSVD